MIHNIVVFEDERYQAVKELGSYSCVGCAAMEHAWCRKINCRASGRDDGTGVIFKPHYKQKGGKWSQEIE